MFKSLCIFCSLCVGCGERKAISPNLSAFLTRNGSQVVIITGSNGGVGYETAKALVKMGAHVIMGETTNATSGLLDTNYQYKHCYGEIRIDTCTPCLDVSVCEKQDVLLRCPKVFRSCREARQP